MEGVSPEGASAAQSSTMHVHAGTRAPYPERVTCTRVCQEEGVNLQVGLIRQSSQTSPPSHILLWIPSQIYASARGEDLGDDEGGFEGNPLASPPLEAWFGSYSSRGMLLGPTLSGAS